VITHVGVAPFSGEQRKHAFVLAARSGVDVAVADGSREGARVMSSAKPSAASIDLVSCAAFERIVAETGSSVYEVIVLRGEHGTVLVRGGKHFTTFCRVWFAGSTRPSGATERHTIEIGLRMKFYFENMVIITSVVQSLSRCSTTAVTACCAATRCAP